MPEPSSASSAVSAARAARPANGRNKGRRADSRATRRRLLDALRRLLDHGHSDLTLQRIAEEAGVSTATAYRYFGSAHDAIQAYVLEFPDEVAAAFAEGEHGERGLARLALWCNTWIRLIDETWGPSLAHLRSPAGFLARRAAGDEIITAVCAHVERPMREALEELELHDESMDLALLLWNAIYDPREILDLRRTLRWTRNRIEEGLWQMFMGALLAVRPDSWNI